jgi:hypothetical protein
MHFGSLKSLEWTPWPFSLRSVHYFPEWERFGSTRDPLPSNWPPENIRNGITRDIIAPSNISFVISSRNEVQPPIEPSPRSQAVLSNASMATWYGSDVNPGPTQKVEIGEPPSEREQRGGHGVAHIWSEWKRIKYMAVWCAWRPKLCRDNPRIRGGSNMLRR